MSRTQAKIDHAVERLRLLGCDAIGGTADVRDDDATASVVKSVHDEFGDLDVLVSGAAGNFLASAVGMSPKAFRAVVDIDLVGTYHVLRAAYPMLKKPGAVVINISAPQATLPLALQSHVCAAKAGVGMLTRVFALEWAPDGIRVNAIVPGPTDETEGMARLAPTDEARALTRPSVPLGRWGTVTDIAEACLFLSSPQAAYITGAVLPVDGGWSLGGVSVAASAINDLLGARSSM